MESNVADKRLLEVIQDIAEGRYSNDIMELTKEDVPEPIREIAEAMGLMMVKVEAREYRLEKLLAQVKQNAINTVSTMAHALAARDKYTEGHAARVAEWGELIATEMGLDRQEVEHVRLGGLLHDIGKISFSDALFDSHGKKNPPELVREIIKHPAIGADILKDLTFLGPALDYVRCHHERLDGSGYPAKIKSDKIPQGAMILAVADGYDAMTTDRPYQKGMAPAVALGNLRKQVPHRLPKDVVDAFESVLTRRGLLEPDPDRPAS